MYVRLFTCYDAHLPVKFSPNQYFLLSPNFNIIYTKVFKAFPGRFLENSPETDSYIKKYFYE